MTEAKLQLIKYKNFLTLLALLIALMFGYKAALIFSAKIGLSPACSAKFQIKDGIGCPDRATCVRAGDLTEKNNCRSSDGVCPVSPNTLTGVKKFIATFNSFSKGRCKITISSAIQLKGGPSESLCHKPDNKKSGTCLDFTITPETDVCFEIFYLAAKDSKIVQAYRNEYKSMCLASTQTGGNIHTEFGESPKEEVVIFEPKLLNNTCSEDCVILCAEKRVTVFGGRDVAQDTECLNDCTARVDECLNNLLK